MSQRNKKRRIAFLNDLCAICGILLTDPRRSQAGNSFNAHGEKKCRDWLRQAEGDYAKWKMMIDDEKARIIASKRHKQKRKIRRVARRSTYQQFRNQCTRDSKCKARDGNIRGTVRPDGSGSGWRNLNRNQEYGLANRM